MSKDCPWSAMRKYKQQNGVCHRQKELNKATEIKSGRGEGRAGLFNYWGGLASLRGQEFKNNASPELNLAVRSVPVRHPVITAQLCCWSAVRSVV
jgi:hypothetical protein